MKLHSTLGIGIGAMLFAAGCAHQAKFGSVGLVESGTYVVTTPGAVTVARQSATVSHTCTLATGEHAKGKHGEHGGEAGPGGGGPGTVLDILLFRLCEARANNDITPEQYASGVQSILKTISEMAERRPPPPGPAARGPWGPGGPGGMREHEWGDHERGDRDRGDREHGDRDRGDHEHGDRDDKDAPDAHRKGPGPGAPGGPPHKDDEKPGGR